MSCRRSDHGSILARPVTAKEIDRRRDDVLAYDFEAHPHAGQATQINRANFRHPDEGCCVSPRRLELSLYEDRWGNHRAVMRFDGAGAVNFEVAHVNGAVRLPLSDSLEQIAALLRAQGA